MCLGSLRPEWDTIHWLELRFYWWWLVFVFALHFFTAARHLHCLCQVGTVTGQETAQILVSRRCHIQRKNQRKYRCNCTFNGFRIAVNSFVMSLLKHGVKSISKRLSLTLRVLKLSYSWNARGNVWVYIIICVWYLFFIKYHLFAGESVLNRKKSDDTQLLTWHGMDSYMEPAHHNNFKLLDEA